jgi:hypothetical protein
MSALLPTATTPNHASARLQPIRNYSFHQHDATQVGLQSSALPRLFELSSAAASKGCQIDALSEIPTSSPSTPRRKPAQFVAHGGEDILLDLPQGG